MQLPNYLYWTMLCVEFYRFCRRTNDKDGKKNGKKLKKNK